MRRSFYLFILSFILSLISVGCKSDKPTPSSNSAGQQDDFRIMKTALVGDNIPISTANGEQQNPQVIYLRDKKLYFVVWEDWRGGDADIYGKFLKDDGSSCGNEFKINSDSPLNQVSPVVAYRQTDRKLLVVWQDGRYNDTNNDGKIGNGERGGIYYRSITLPAGDIDCGTFNPSPNNDETAVSFNAVFSENLISRSKPRVAYNAVKDEFFIVWIETRDTLKRISQACFGGLGTVGYSLGGDPIFIGYSILRGSDLTEKKIDIVRTDSGGNGTFNVRKISHTRTDEFTEVHNYEYLDSITGIDISCNVNSGICSVVSSGKYVKTTLTCQCQDRNNSQSCDVGDSITGSLSNSVDDFNGIHQIYDFEFNQATTMRKLNSGSANAYNPSIAFDPVSKKFLVVWEDFRDNSSFQKIYGVLMFSEGGKYGQDFIISYIDTDGNGENDILNSKQTYPAVSYDDVNQRFFVVWQDGRNGSISNENLDIYGQYVDSEGSLRGSNYFISNHPANQLAPVIAYNPDKNEFLAVWKDARNKDTTGSDIYGQRFSLGQPQIEILDENNKSLRPSLLDYGSVSLNRTVSKSIKIKNIGDANLKIYDLTSLDGSPFSFSGVDSKITDGNTGTYLELPPSAEITITINFKPESKGSFNKLFTIKTDAGNKDIALQGIGISASAPVLYIDQTMLTVDFGTVKSNTTLDKSITIKNTGDDTLNITSCGADIPGFKVKTCPTTVAAGSEATITYTFEPKDVVAYTGKMTIQTDAGSKDITLKGEGKGAKISTNLQTVDFGTVEVNSEISKELIITNTGNDTLTINSITATNPFSITTTGSTPIKVIPGSSITVLVKFKANTAGNYTDSLSISSDAINSPSIPLQANAVSTNIVVNPSSVDFGTVQLNSTVSKVVTIKNDSVRTVNILSVDSPSSPFSVDQPLTKTLKPGESVNLVVKFAPTSAGAFSSAVSILFDHSSTPVLITLKGKSGSATSSAITFDTTVLNFGKVLINQTAAKSFTVNSASPVNIVSISVTSPYRVIKTTPFTVNTEESITVTLNSSRAGVYNGTFTIKDESGNTYQLPVYGEVVDSLVEGVVDYTKNTSNPNVSGFTPVTGFDLVVKIGQTVKITYPSLPSDAVVYIRTKSGYRKIHPQLEISSCVSDINVKSEELSFKLSSAECFEVVSSDTVVTTVYIGRASSSVSAPSAPSTGDSVAVPPPPSVKSGGGGGCSMSKTSGFDAGWVVIILTLFGLRFIRKGGRFA